MTLVKDTHGTNLTIYGMWKVQHTPTPPPVVLSLTPIPTTPQPARPPMTQRLQEWSHQVKHPAWQLFRWEDSNGQRKSYVASALHPEWGARFLTLEACEGAKDARLQAMAQHLATRTDTGPSTIQLIDGGTVHHIAPQMQKRILYLCAVSIDGHT